MKYEVIRTDHADDQLRQIIFYIAEESGSREVALAYLDKIEKAIGRLEDFPDSGSLPHYTTLRKPGYRVLVIERHLAFYKIEDANKRVVIYAILSARQEYQRFL